MSQEFAQLLRRYFDESGMTRRKIEKLIDVSGGYLTHVLLGSIDPGPEKAEALARVLNIPPDEQALFLLTAAGHSLETAQQALEAIQPTSGVLSAGKKLLLKRDERGQWGVIPS